MLPAAAAATAPRALPFGLCRRPSAYTHKPPHTHEKKRSADAYEFSTEALFFGRQDAMQRASLAPIADYVASRAAFVARAQCVFDMMAAGTLRIRIGREFPLAEAAAAQEHLTGRGSVGKCLLRC